MSSMAPHRRTAQRDDANLRPPLHGDERANPPRTLVRTAPQWEIPLRPGIDLGFTHAKGTIHLRPPAN
jgi:hypothetical protein